MSSEYEPSLDNVLEIVKTVTPRIVEAVKRQQNNPDDAYLDQKIGLSYRKMRMEKELSIDDVVRIIGADGFETLELMMFEHGLVSFKELDKEVRTGLLAVVPGLLDSDDLADLLKKEQEEPELKNGK